MTTRDSDIRGLLYEVMTLRRFNKATTAAVVMTAAAAAAVAEVEVVAWTKHETNVTGAAPAAATAER